MDLWAVGVAILMLLLFGGVAFLVRRLGLGGGAGLLTKNTADIQVVGARRLDLNATLYIVEVEGRRLLVGSGRDGARLVADLTSEP